MAEYFTRSFLSVSLSLPVLYYPPSHTYHHHHHHHPYSFSHPLPGFVHPSVGALCQHQLHSKFSNHAKERRKPPQGPIWIYTTSNLSFPHLLMRANKRPSGTSPSIAPASKTNKAASILEHLASNDSSFLLSHTLIHADTHFSSDLYVHIKRLRPTEQKKRKERKKRFRQ